MQLKAKGGIELQQELENFDQLLEEYRSIWNNRLLHKGECSSEELLTEAIKRELLDENSHPRIRKNKYEKYFFAIKRIINSSVSDSTKVTLIKIHMEIMETIS